MPDTDANQKEFPQSTNQKKGVGFPLARLVLIVSLTTGCILRSLLGSHKGKGTGETSQFAQMLCEFQPKDLLVADSGFSHYWIIASLIPRGPTTSATSVRHAKWTTVPVKAVKAVKAELR